MNPASDRSVLDKKVKLYCVTTRFKPVRYWQYYRLLLKHGSTSEVIYAMGPVNAGLFAMKAAKKLGKKFVVKVVGDYAWEQGQVRGLVRDSIDEFQTKKYVGKIGRLQKIEREVVHNADCVVVPSKYLAGIVKGWGADEKKIKVIQNAAELKDVQGAPKPGTEKWIVSVGRLVPWKGMKTLIEIMPEILEKHSNARLKIIGDGPEMNNLKKCVEDLKLQETVDLLGNLSHEEALRYIKSANVFILNSGYEGLSHVLLEVSYFRVPLYASKSGGNVEVVRDDHLFEYNNKAQIKECVVHAFSLSPEVDFANRDVLLGAEVSRDMMIEETKTTLESV